MRLEKEFTSSPGLEDLVNETYYQSYGIVVALRRQLPEKLTTYECGIDPVGTGWSQTQIRYYIYAFLFVIFDVESVFLFPWAVIFERIGMQGVVEMAIF